MTDGPSDSASANAVTGSASSSAADDFQPDVPTDLHVGTVAAPEASPPPNGESSDPDLETTAFGTGDPIEFDAPSSPGSDSAAPSDEQQLVPGASIARGRYRLLVFHGGAPHTQFWQALDTALNRQVALTFVDPEGALPDEQLREILARTMRLSRIDKIGIARILDVVHTGAGGLVVTEWVRGGSLQEVADTSPSAAGASRAMQTPGRRGRGRPPRRRRAVDRPSQPGAGQHRRRCRAGLPRDDAGHQPRGRHPRHRRGFVCVAGQSVAAARVRSTQRDGAGTARFRRPTARAQRHRWRHPVPDLRGGRPLAAGRWWDTQCSNAFEFASAGDGGGRPYRAARPHRRRRSFTDAPASGAGPHTRH